MDNNKTFILGGGASLTENLYNKINSFEQPHTKIAVNFAYKFTNPDILIFLDHDIYFKNTDLPKCRTISKEWAKYPSYIEQVDLSLYYCGNPYILSGVFAIDWALKNGFDNIYLFGFDCKSINGKTHHHEFSRPKDVFTNSVKLYEPFRGKNIKTVGETNLTMFDNVSEDYAIS